MPVPGWNGRSQFPAIVRSQLTFASLSGHPGPDALANPSVNTVSVETVFAREFGIAMSYETIGNPHAHDTHLVLKSVFLEQLQNRRTKSACEVGLFDSYQQTFGSARLQQSRIEWFDEARIDNGGFNTILCEVISRFNEG